MTDPKATKHSWFYRWFLNNKATIALINILLALGVIWMLANVSWVFTPVGDFLMMVFPPVVLSAVLYYLIEPLVKIAERRFKIHRIWTITIVFVVIIGLIVWGIVALIPIIQEQTQQIIDNWPKYWKNIQATADSLLSSSQLDGVRDQINTQFDSLSKTVVKQFNDNIADWFSNITSAVGVITSIFVTIATAPFVLFFMLKDGPKFKKNLLAFVPVKFRQPTGELLSDINLSLSNYIRGQLTVAFWVGVMFSIGYSIVGQKYALTLGVLAGFLNLIPYLGSFLAIIPALIIAAFTAPLMVVKVLIVFAIEQTIESRFVSPLVVGSKMEMHPVTTLLILLAAGKMFGLLGVLLGIPVYAVVKIIFMRFFEWFKSVSGLYEPEAEPEPQVDTEKNKQDQAETDK
ncbi:AI-2E family transporter [Lapidilactobacillus mulanensis]|uniref:AI-2E family transporter n=1 Tax=Lapidilactobacillus mulanensis TaxID=2485999 RepID=A0ABW4DMT5_9LACO|nr:AI-2E family transporter [Lapidilactobacillus mulanensis]